MSKVGQVERVTQNRVIKIFEKKLGYEYLGDWQDEEDNSNIEREWLVPFLQKQGYDEYVRNQAIKQIEDISKQVGKSLYDRNKEIYELLRYGVKVRPEVGENTQTVWLIDWKHPERNHFGIAEEVTVLGATRTSSTKRPDIVLYVNGIALGILELKRSSVSIGDGIRQNLDNQEPGYILPFFSTMQLVMAGNDSQGLRYGTIETKEKHYLTWKENEEEDNPLESILDRHLMKLCNKTRFLEIIHDFVVFDAGTKKLCRPNQYFGVKSAQEFIKRREGGIIWHTQGSGKSLTMVWLAKWIREHVPNSRMLIITDRIELDEQIEKVFSGVYENIYRTKNGADLIAKLNSTTPWLLCSLIHKFRGKEDLSPSGDLTPYLQEMQQAILPGFLAQGDWYVFVDECHRTQSGELHQAMKSLLPTAVFLGFTGTPLLKADKKKSIEIFGRYIHTYKFDEAVKDKVILDLRYEARHIDQNIKSLQGMDTWFEEKTKGMTDVAKVQLKKRWGTLRKVYSSRDRLNWIVNDICLDMEREPRLQSGHGNALLVSGSIYQACKFYEMFVECGFSHKCAIITSFQPTPNQAKLEGSGEGHTEKIQQNEIYKKMLADWFQEPPETAVFKIEEFERAVKKKFIEEPGQMKLLIVVDKLLTGFDAPKATYLYIDKTMRDHGLFQAIARVNRQDESKTGEDKEYGYIIDYKDLFKSLESAVIDYTSDAFDGYDQEDVAGLLGNRIEKAKERLEETRETVKALCEPVGILRTTEAYIYYFCAKESGNIAQLLENEPRRKALYQHVPAFLRAYANIANDLEEAGYTPDEIVDLKKEVDHYQAMWIEVKLASGDSLDLKQFEPAMRRLIDMYIRAEESKTISNLDQMTLIELMAVRGKEAIDSMPKGIRESPIAIAETIENNIRRLITDEKPTNPKYYDKMSNLLDDLIQRRKQEALAYEQYLTEALEFINLLKNPSLDSYPKLMNTSGKRALYDNLNQNEELVLLVDHAIQKSRQDDWRSHPMKMRKVELAIKAALSNNEERTCQILELVKNQQDY